MIVKASGAGPEGQFRGNGERKFPGLPRAAPAEQAGAVVPIRRGPAGGPERGAAMAPAGGGPAAMIARAEVTESR